MPSSPLQQRVDLAQDLTDLLPLAGEVLVLVLGTNLPGAVAGAALLVGADVGLVDLGLDLALRMVNFVDALDQQGAKVRVGEARGDRPGLVFVTVAGRQDAERARRIDGRLALVADQ